MSNYKRVATSAEVWAVLHARHPEMVVYGSYSTPKGDEFGDMNQGKMISSYGFPHGNFPIIEYQVTWDINRDKPNERANQCREYWLCLPMVDDET